MPEFRQDPLSGRWVIIAEDRAGRPHDYVAPPVSRKEDTCPFCAGNEHETPTAVASYALVNSTAAWDVRVVPNKFPAVASDPHPPATSWNGRTAVGRHEVIIESHRHLSSFTALPADAGELVFRVYQERLHAIDRDRFPYGLVFKNTLPAAGASLEHLHSQLIALPFVPPDVARVQGRMREHFESSRNCLLCDAQRTAAERVVAETEHLIAFCPYASRFAYETWILPKEHQPRFEDFSGTAECSWLVGDVVRRLETFLNRPAYNYLIDTAPFDSSPGDYYHWHIELFPRLTKCAGFEWASGCYINPVRPESAASRLAGVASSDKRGQTDWKD